MPIIRNISRSIMVLEHVEAEPIVLKPNESVEVPAKALNESVEVPAKALALPLIRHYIQAKRLDLVSQQPQSTNVILTR
jgi:hypothetical protein